MIKFANKYYSFIRKYLALFLITISCILLWHFTDSEPESKKVTKISQAETEQSQKNEIALSNKSLPVKSQTRESKNKDSVNNINVWSNPSLDDETIEVTQDMIEAFGSEESEANRTEYDSDYEEPMSPEVEAALNGDEDFDPIEFDLDQPPVTMDNENEIPVGEHVDQILQGDIELAEHESEFNEDDFNSPPPIDKNVTVKEPGEFADQIDQAELNEQAVFEGLEIETNSTFELKEVEPDSHPPA